MLLVSSSQSQRSIYFQRRQNLEAVHAAILAKQGFSLENRLEQYQVISKLGEGTFGTVMLAQHKFSQVKVAIKMVDKSKIARLFTQNNQMFQELEVLRICTQG